MSISIHDAVVPPVRQTLKGLAAVLGKAEAHATALRIEPSALLLARLYPDMFTMTRQVQIACDMAKAGVCRLAAREVPNHPDTEASFQELQARITKVLDLIDSIPAAEIDAAAGRTVTIKVAGQEMSFPGPAYATTWVMPNFYFHVTTAYAILRHNGVPIGKSDYLGR
jgi:uncharacterized protein